MGRRYGADFGLVTYDQAWLHSLTGLVQRLRGTGASVLVLGPVPDPQPTVPTCLSAHPNNAMECSPARSVALTTTVLPPKRPRLRPGGGKYADLSELFCTAERCPVIVGNTLVYRDDNHVTIEYAQVLAELLDGALAS